MISIDSDIEQSWLSPSEGWTQEGDEDEDFVAFGKTCVDRMISSVGDAIMLPLIGTLVMNTISNDSDWRFKNASLMAFSQIGEYVDEPKKIEQMIPVIVSHCTHANPKVRYAAFHAIGQIADDMQEKFQKEYSVQIVPVLINGIDDQVPRVVSHACAALTNFMEGYKTQMSETDIRLVTQKLMTLVQQGISLVKENAVTALATVVEQAKEGFIPFFNETVNVLVQALGAHSAKEYK